MKRSNFYRSIRPGILKPHIFLYSPGKYAYIMSVSRLSDDYAQKFVTKVKPEAFKNAR